MSFYPTGGTTTAQTLGFNQDFTTIGEMMTTQLSTNNSFAAGEISKTKGLNSPILKENDETLLNTPAEGQTTYHRYPTGQPI